MSNLPLGMVLKPYSKKELELVGNCITLYEEEEVTTMEGPSRNIEIGRILQDLFIHFPELTNEELDVIISRASFILEDRIRAVQLEDSMDREIL